MMTPEFVLQLLGSIGTALGVYGAIRADLAAAKIRAEQAQKAADDAHSRISDHIDKHHTR